MDRLNARNSIRNAVSQNGMSLQLTALSSSHTARSPVRFDMVVDIIEILTMANFQTTVQVFRETKITSDAWVSAHLLRRHHMFISAPIGREWAFYR